MKNKIDSLLELDDKITTIIVSLELSHEIEEYDGFVPTRETDMSKFNRMNTIGKYKNVNVVTDCYQSLMLIKVGYDIRIDDIKVRVKS